MLDSPPSTPHGRAERRGWRLLAGVLLLVSAAIHAYERTDTDVLFLVCGFTATVVGTVAGAVLLLTRAPRLGWTLGGLTALLTFAGYVVTRSTPVPTDEDDYGNWLEPLGILSLVVEAGVVVLAVWALTGTQPMRPRHLVYEARELTPGVAHHGRPGATAGKPPDNPPPGAPGRHRRR